MNEARDTVIRIEKADGSTVEWTFPPGWSKNQDSLADEIPQAADIRTQVRDALEVA